MDRPDEKTTAWTSDELSSIEGADELEIAPRRRDGTLRTPVPIWVVRVGDDLHVRAAYGPGTGWYRVARRSREGRIRAGGVEKDVTIEDADHAVNEQVDAAYRAKYHRLPREHRRQRHERPGAVDDAQARAAQEHDRGDLLSTDQDSGRVAVITGASSGIGEATARALAADGHRLALLARRADRVRALAGELGNGALAIEADVTDRDSVVAAAERVQQELGGADILVNNAGVMLLGPFTSGQRAEHRQMVETNLLGAMTATEVFLDQLRDGGGDLVNISSVAGRRARAGNAGYAATKWGLNGWSEALRQELQPDIRVMVIEPGAVATELTDHITHAEAKQATEQMYARMSITAEDIAEVIAFAVGRPRRMTLNEILIRPTGQAF